MYHPESNEKEIVVKEMTPRERAYAALNFQEPDRVPISFAGGVGNRIVESVPDGMICSELYQYLGIKDPEPVMITETSNLVNHPDERAVQRLHSDIRAIWGIPLQPAINPDGTPNMVSSVINTHQSIGHRVKRIGLYDMPVDDPMLYMTTEKDIDEYPWSDPDAKIDIPEEFIERARHFHEDTNYFVSGLTGRQNPWYFFETAMDRWLIDMKIRPKFHHKMMGKIVERMLAYDEQWFGVMGKYLDAAWVGDDLGTQENPLISHDDYLEFCKPYQAEIVRTIRKHLRPEAKIIMHSCGSVYPFIEDFIEIGIDVLNPIQPLAKNMEPWRLKRDFGGRIAFLGGFDTQMLLSLGTVGEVREGARRLLQQLAPGGGFVFGMSHNIQPHTPLENITAAFDAALEYGKYPVPEPTSENFIDFVTGLSLSEREVSR